MDKFQHRFDTLQHQEQQDELLIDICKQDNIKYHQLIKKILAQYTPCIDVYARCNKLITKDKLKMLLIDVRNPAESYSSGVVKHAIDADRVDLIPTLISRTPDTQSLVFYIIAKDLHVLFTESIEYISENLYPSIIVCAIDFGRLNIIVAIINFTPMLRRLCNLLYVCVAFRQFDILRQILEYPIMRSAISPDQIGSCITQVDDLQMQYTVIELLISLESSGQQNPQCNCNQEYVRAKFDRCICSDEYKFRFDIPDQTIVDLSNTTITPVPYLSMCMRHLVVNSSLNAMLYITNRITPSYNMLINLVKCQNVLLLQHFIAQVRIHLESMRWPTLKERYYLASETLGTNNIKIIKIIIDIYGIGFELSNITQYVRYHRDVLEIALRNCTSRLIKLSEFSVFISSDVLEVIFEVCDDYHTYLILQADVATKYKYAVASASKQILKRLLCEHNPVPYYDVITETLSCIGNVRKYKILPVLMCDSRLRLNIYPRMQFARRYYCEHQKILATELALAFVKYPVMIQYEIFQQVVVWIPTKRRMTMYNAWEIMKMVHKKHVTDDTTS